MLRSCHTAVFDFSSYVRDAPVENATLAAAVAYELGIALTLGKAMLIVACEDQDLPLDVDAQSVRLQNDKGDAGRLASAIDDVIYGHQREGLDDSISATFEFLQNELRRQKDAITKQ
jgi:hypothetical protein